MSVKIISCSEEDVDDNTIINELKRYFAMGYKIVSHTVSVSRTTSWDSGGETVTDYENTHYFTLQK